jgi:phospholipase C
MSFLNIQNSTSRCNNIVNAETNFAADVAKGADAPQYMYYVPNLKNDAHDTNVTYAQADLMTLVDTMLNNKAFMKNTLILITFDENGKYSGYIYPI